MTMPCCGEANAIQFNKVVTERSMVVYIHALYAVENIFRVSPNTTTVLFIEKRFLGMDIGRGKLDGGYNIVPIILSKLLLCRLQINYKYN